MFGNTKLVPSAENLDLVLVHLYSLHNILSQNHTSQAVKSTAEGTENLKSAKY